VDQASAGDSTEMTAEEKQVYLPSNPKPKKKTRIIAHASEHGSFFYSQLYQLAADLYEKMDAHCTNTFRQLPKEKSKTATIHKVRQWIAKKQI
jgi:hypothetical protein